MRKVAVLMSLIAVMMTTTACQKGAGSTPAPRSTPELQKIIGAGNKSTVVFFLNPAGGPCRAQNEVLQKLYQDRGGNFNVAFVSTMKPEDQQAFYDYGVRNLPTVVLVDRSGKISRNFPPGIQSYEALAAGLDGIK